MVYIQNKYTTWYMSIVNRAKARTLDSDTYSESHHIVPECLFINRTRRGPKGYIEGNPDAPINIVELTSREHFVCHLLLPKMISGPGKYKMLKAAIGMSFLQSSGQSRKRVTSRQYSLLMKQLSNTEMPEEIRKNYVTAALLREEKRREHGLGGTFKGKKHTEETKAKLRVPKTSEQKEHQSRVMKGKNLGKPAHNKGKTFEELYGIERANELRKKIKHVGEKNGFFGKQHSPEQRAKKRQEKLAAPKITCYHCSKETDPMNYARWHGDKCKQRK